MPASKPLNDGKEPGLVRGLRGQYPFDGTQFPPLPWGGSRVAAPDILFIKQWIDHGCPASEEDSDQKTGAASATRSVALGTGHEAHPAFAAPVNEFANETGARKVRKNINFLSEEELRRFRAAIAQMKSLNAFPQDERSFAYWARIHANQCQHGWEEFLTWHRAYLYGFEKQLQDVDATVTLPYWDWSADFENVKASIEDMSSTSAKDNGYVPEAYQCWIDEAGLAKLTDEGTVPQEDLGGLRKVLGTRFSSGSRLLAEAKIVYGRNPESDKAIVAVLEQINPLWNWRRWPGGNSNLIFEAYPTPGDIDRILEIENFFTFGSGSAGDRYFGAVETVHNLIHNFSGGANPGWTGAPTPGNEFEYGDMQDAGRTAFDPIFWGHHSNVDRLWAQWQRRFPGRGPDNASAILPPWKFTVAEMSSTRLLGYEYMLAAHIFPTDSEVPLQRFRSAATPIKAAVIERHRGAEVRLHAVQFVPRPGFFIRVFINTPHATLETPTRGNPNFVGQVSMFTGDCVGGPAHCEVPDTPVDRFDLRPRHRKTPASFRLDASAAVRTLAAAGSTNFEINVAAYNSDGSPADDALKLDAVSLNFFD
jgi:tyrosinase